MKKILFFCVAIMAISLISCEKNDPKDEKASILGSWKTEVEMYITDTWTFKSDGTGTMHFETNYEDEDPFESTISFTYSINGNKLTVIINDDDYLKTNVATIVSITDTELILILHYEDEEDEDEQVTFQRVK